MLLAANANVNQTASRRWPDVKSGAWTTVAPMCIACQPGYSYTLSRRCGDTDGQADLSAGHADVDRVRAAHPRLAPSSSPRTAPAARPVGPHSTLRTTSTNARQAGPQRHGQALARQRAAVLALLHAPARARLRVPGRHLRARRADALQRHQRPHHLPRARAFSSEATSARRTSICPEPALPDGLRAVSGFSAASRASSSCACIVAHRRRATTAAVDDGGDRRASSHLAFTPART